MSHVSRGSNHVPYVYTILLHHHHYHNAIVKFTIITAYDDDVDDLKICYAYWCGKV